MKGKDDVESGRVGGYGKRRRRDGAAVMARAMRWALKHLYDEEPLDAIKANTRKEYGAVLRWAVDNKDEFVKKLMVMKPEREKEQESPEVLVGEECIVVLEKWLQRHGVR